MTAKIYKLNPETGMRKKSYTAIDRINKVEQIDQWLIMYTELGECVVCNREDHNVEIYFN